MELVVSYEAAVSVRPSVTYRHVNIGVDIIKHNNMGIFNESCWKIVFSGCIYLK
jgi:BarA-like signal transduction histidine kinase